MRITNLRKKIIFNFIILGIISIILGVGIFYNFYSSTSVEEKLQKIKNDTAQIRVKAAELQNKSIEIKKYTEIYEKLSENKKSINGIKMDDINGLLKTIADKYAIISPTIKVNLPETLKDPAFNRSTITVSYTTVNLNFSALNDLKAFGFINEFIESIPGFTVITNMEIKRGKAYTTQDLIEISTGKSKGGVTGKVDFYWYVAKSKDEPKKDQPKTPETTKTPEVVNAPEPTL